MKNNKKKFAQLIYNTVAGENIPSSELTCIFFSYCTPTHFLPCKKSITKLSVPTL
jgi:hypothetical protein